MSSKKLQIIDNKGFASEEYVDDSIENLSTTVSANVNALNTKVGDVPVSEQITNAINSHEHSWNDLTDKPFGEVDGEVVVRWDGNTVGLEFIPEGNPLIYEKAYKISDLAPSMSEIAPVTLESKFTNLSTGEVKESIVVYSEDELLYFDDDCLCYGKMDYTNYGTFLVVTKDIELDGAVASAGIYVVKTGRADIYGIRYNGKTIKTIDTKYLPEGIAMVEDVDELINGITYPVDSVNGKTGDVTLTASDVGAAPAGYGLGTAETQLANWDYATENGWYVAAGNSPTGNAWHGLVHKYTDNYILQHIYSYGNDDDSVRQCFRVKNANGWGKWHTVGVVMEKLWENASTTSNFAAQTIALDLSEYQAVYVECLRSTESQVVSGRILLDVGGISGYIMGTTNQFAVTRREVTVTTTGVTFTGFYSANTSNGTSNEIPYRIYGIKGVGK